MRSAETIFTRNAVGDRDEQALARLAYIARSNLYSGEASAMTLAERAGAMGLPLAHDMDFVVGEVYTRGPNGACAFTVHECDECGQRHYGREPADVCCTDEEPIAEDEFEFENG